MDWSALCDCGISWSLLLTFLHNLFVKAYSTVTEAVSPEGLAFWYFLAYRAAWLSDFIECNIDFYFHLLESCLAESLEIDQAAILSLCVLMSSADDLCKQFGPRSGPTKCRAWSGSKQFDTLMVFPKEFFEKVDFEKNQQTAKNHENCPACKELYSVVWASSRDNLSSGVYEQHRPIPACPSAQSDQHLCCSLFEKYHM